jgi:hypothetical protein
MADHHDFNSVELEQLPLSELKLLLPQLIASLDTNDSSNASGLRSLKTLRQRANEPDVAETLAALLTESAPLMSLTDLSTARVIIWSILFELPFAALQAHYQKALTDFASWESASSSKDPASQAYQPQEPHLRETALLLARFASSLTEIWTPTSKFDAIAFRSLNERVHTPTEMAPHVPGLLEWLADPNWPVYGGCVEQLARFPDVSVEPIRELIERERGDGTWIENGLQFVHDNVFVEQWGILEGVLRDLEATPKGDESDCEVGTVAREMLAKLDAQGST